MSPGVQGTFREHALGSFLASGRDRLRPVGLALVTHGLVTDPYPLMAASHGHGPRHVLFLVTVTLDSSLVRRRHHRHDVSRSLHALLQQRTHLPAAGYMASGAIP
eukprot:3736419-Prymnesium_polylepis.1